MRTDSWCSANVAGSFLPRIWSRCEHAGVIVSLHGAPHTINGFYEKFGVPLGRYRRYRFEDFHGDASERIDLRDVRLVRPEQAPTKEEAEKEFPTSWVDHSSAAAYESIDIGEHLDDGGEFDPVTSHGCHSVME